MYCISKCKTNDCSDVKCQGASSSCVSVLSTIPNNSPCTLDPKDLVGYGKLKVDYKDLNGSDLLSSDPQFSTNRVLDVKIGLDCSSLFSLSGTILNSFAPKEYWISLGPPNLVDWSFNPES